MPAQFLDRVRNQRPAGKRAHRNQAGAAIGEFEYLQSLRKIDQLQQIVGHCLLGKDHVRGAKAAFTHQIGMLLQLGIAYPRYARRNVVQIGGDFAGHQIGLVIRGDSDQHVRVSRTACLQR